MNKRIALKEYAAYGISGMGQNMVYILSSMFLMIYYTDVFMIPLQVVGILFLVARLWDACNDFIMGVIVDNTRTKWGKLRPFLMIAPIPIAILTILTFTAPNLTYSLKIVYVFVTYILWGMFYTVGDVPYWGMSASMTNDTKERTILITVTRFLTMVGAGTAMIVIPKLVNTLGNGSDRQGYFLTAIIIAVVGCGLFYFAFFGTRERFEAQKEKTTLTGNYHLLKQNIPLLIILLSSVLGFSRFMAQSAGTYVAKYNLGDGELLSKISAVLFLAILFSIILTPFLLKVFSKKNLYIISSIIGAILYIIMFLVGYQNFNQVLIFVFFTSLSIGFFNVLQTAMIADSVDYLEWKTGKRAEGLCYASQTFFFKLSGALTNFTVSQVLFYTGFIANSPNQHPQVYTGIFSLVSLIPGIGCLLSIIPMFFYKFTEDKQKQCVEEIKLRKINLGGDEYLDESMV